MDNFEGKGMTVHPYDTAVSCAKTAEPIEMPFELWTRVDPIKHVLDEGTHWRHLANTIEPSMCSSDETFLSNYFDHLFCFSFIDPFERRTVDV